MRIFMVSRAFLLGGAVLQAQESTLSSRYAPRMEQILKEDLARFRDGGPGLFAAVRLRRRSKRILRQRRLPADADGRAEARRTGAEAVVSALCQFRPTGEKRCPGVFERTFRFIDDTLIGRKGGEWFEFIAPGGRSAGEAVK